MKNVLQIMDYAAPYRGNFIPSMEALADYWKSFGDMVFLFPDGAKNVSWIRQFQQERRVYFISRSFFSKKINITLIKELQRIIEQEEISIIHTHFVEANYNLFLFSKLIYPNIRYIVSLHNHYAVTGRFGWIRKIIFKRLYDRVCGVSQSVVDSALKIGCSKDKVIVARNSIHFERLKTSLQQRIIEHDGYERIVMMLGHPWMRKGTDIAIQAIEKLNEKGKIFKLAIVYSGKVEDYERIIIEKLGQIPPFVQVYPPNDDIANYYNSSDIFLSASREEGFCYALVEAAYCSSYIITSNIPAPISLAIPYMASYEVESPEKLSALLLEFLEMDDNQLMEIKKAQQEYVVNEFNLYHWAQTISKAYQ